VKAAGQKNDSLAEVPRKLRAHYRNGGLQLREPLDLPENTEVEILLRLPPKRS
jgi:hypothetical protein